MASSFTLVATFSGIVLIASLLAGTRRDVPVDNDYSHVGTFSYRAYGGGDVYDTPFAETGDPVFRSLADSVDLRFDYRLDTSLVAAVSGTYSLVARLSHPNGWTRTLELAPPGAFDEAPFSIEGVFDLSRAQELIDRMEEQAVMNNEAYVVTFVADVEVAGTVGGHEFADPFSAEVTFRLDPRRLQLLNGGGADGAPLSTIQGGAVRAVRTEDRTLAAFGLSTRVVDAQAVAAVALGASLVGLAMLGALALVIRRRGEAAMIRARYGDLLLPARLTQLSGAAALVEISDIKHLVEIARREGLMVLHEEDGDGDCFMVVGRDAVHYYRTRAEPAAPAEARAEAPPNLVLMPGPGTDSARPAQPDGRDLRRAG